MDFAGAFPAGVFMGQGQAQFDGAGQIQVCKPIIGFLLLDSKDVLNCWSKLVVPRSYQNWY